MEFIGRAFDAQSGLAGHAVEGILGCDQVESDDHPVSLQLSSHSGRGNPPAQVSEHDQIRPVRATSAISNRQCGLILSRNGAAVTAAGKTAPIWPRRIELLVR